MPVGLSNIVTIAAGANHSLALKSDGTVIGWGNNSGGQTNVPVGLSNVVAIAAGSYSSLALRSDGTVVQWGADFPPPAGLSNLVAIASGSYHKLALKNDGTVVAWGPNGDVGTNVPVGLSNVVVIAAGGFNSLALKTDGTIVSWGYLTNAPAGLSNVVAIATGYGLSPPRSFAIWVNLRIASIALNGQAASLRFSTFSGRHYSVEYSPDLGPGSWLALPGGDVQGNWPEALVRDPNLGGALTRFYRFKLLP